MKPRFLTVALALVVTLMAIAPQVMAQDTSDDRGNPIELTGPIMAIENDGVSLTITISGFTVDVTGAEVTTSLIIGAVVEAEGVLLDDGTIVAREVKAPDAPDADSDDSDDELEFVGTLDSLIAGTAVVSGVSFDITGAEVMLGLVVGDLVKVHASYDDTTQTWIARELELFTGDDAGSDDSDDDGDGDDDRSRDDADDDSDGDDDSLDTCTFEVEVRSANLRSGPGVGYDVVGFAFDDDEFVALEIDSTSSWVKVATAEGDAWIAVSTGELEDDCSALGVSAMPFMSDDDRAGDVDDDSDDDRADVRDDDRDDDSDDDRDDDSDDDSDDDRDDDRDDDSDDDRDVDDD